MTARVELVTGVSGAGKTRLVLNRYREALRQAHRRGDAGATLWLSPTRRACRSVLDGLLDDSLPVSFAPNVLTFDEFAERVLRAAHHDVTPLSDAAKRTLLRRILDRLNAQGRLEHFGELAGTPGFLDLASRFVSELKRDETWPEQFVRACRALGTRPKDRELALIYERYQQALTEHGVYDAEGRFWSARAAIADGHRAPFERLTDVVVDGFTDFTHTQYEILELLAGWAERMSITLPLEDPPRRDDLFDKSMQALGRLRSMEAKGVPVAVVHLAAQGDDRPYGLRHLADNLFANPRAARPADRADGLEILEVAGQTGEVAALAARIKQSLLSGTAPDEIVVAVRGLDESADLFRERFSAAGIPYWCEAGTPLLRAPVMKALLSVVNLEREDWPFDRLMSVLGSNHFRPDWKKGDSHHSCVAAVLRAQKLHAGREAILKAVRRLAERDDADKEDDDGARGGPSNAKTACQVLDQLAAATEVLRGERSFADWTAGLLALGRALGIAPDRQPPRSVSPDEKRLWEQDRRVWERFERALREAVQTERLLGDGGPLLGLGEFQARLTELLRSQAVPPAPGERGRVRLLEADQVRNLDVPDLFLAGLTEGSFPQHRSEDCVYGETERQRLNEHGLTLRHRASHSRDEMLLFYGVATRARRTLVLSYPSVSASGEPLFPSPYVTAIRDLFQPGAIPTEAIAQLDRLPSADDVLTASDLRLVATLRVREGDAGWFRSLLDDPSTTAMAQGVLAAAEMDTARFHTRGFTAYEGLLAQPANRDALAERFHRDYEFSATQLEQYAQCPFQFFAEHVLKVRPAESPEAGTDYRWRGILVHSILAELHRGLAGDHADPPSSKESIAGRFRELVDRELGQRRSDTELREALTAIERRLLTEWADQYAEQWGAYQQRFGSVWDAPPRPALFEQPFGDVPAGEDARPRDAAATLPAVSFGSGKRKTRVAGRIDRVDVGAVAGRDVFNVIDYKTGRLPRFSEDDVRSGRALQLVLYTAAIRRLGAAGRNAHPFQMGFWSVKDQGFVDGMKGGRKSGPAGLEAAAFAALEELLDEVVPQLAANLRAGRFAVFNADEECTEFCPYSTVCRVQQIRALPPEMLKTFEASLSPSASRGKAR